MWIPCEEQDDSLQRFRWVTLPATLRDSKCHDRGHSRVRPGVVRAAGYDETFVFLRDELMAPDSEVDEAHTNRVAEALKEVSLLVSRGNIMVYAELAIPFLELTRRYSNVWDRDDKQFNEFLGEHLRPGPIEQDGQDFLIEPTANSVRGRNLH